MILFLCFSVTRTKTFVISIVELLRFLHNDSKVRERDFRHIVRLSNDVISTIKSSPGIVVGWRNKVAKVDDEFAGARTYTCCRRRRGRRSCANRHPLNNGEFITKRKLQSQRRPKLKLPKRTLPQGRETLICRPPGIRYIIVSLHKTVGFYRFRSAENENENYRRTRVTFELRTKYAAPSHYMRDPTALFIARH